VLNDAATMIRAPNTGRLELRVAGDLILISVRNWGEFTARPQHDRIVCTREKASTQHRRIFRTSTRWKE
jgi:hypothetical protein